MMKGVFLGLPSSTPFVRAVILAGEPRGSSLQGRSVHCKGVTRSEAMRIKSHIALLASVAVVSRRVELFLAFAWKFGAKAGKLSDGRMRMVFARYTIWASLATACQIGSQIHQAGRSCAAQTSLALKNIPKLPRSAACASPRFHGGGEPEKNTIYMFRS